MPAIYVSQQWQSYSSAPASAIVSARKDQDLVCLIRSVFPSQGYADANVAPSQLPVGNYEAGPTIKQPLVEQTVSSDVSAFLVNYCDAVSSESAC